MASIVVTRWSPMSRAASRSGIVYVRGGICEVGGGSKGSPGKGLLTLVTICQSGYMVGESMTVEYIAVAAWGGDFYASCTLSSGAGRLVVSLIWEEVVGSGCFGVFGFYFPF